MTGGVAYWLVKQGLELASDAQTNPVMAIR
jgi:hypothetical protein